MPDSFLPVIIVTRPSSASAGMLNWWFLLPDLPILMNLSPGLPTMSRSSLTPSLETFEAVLDGIQSFRGL